MVRKQVDLECGRNMIMLSC